jgi:hypothetical protein
MPMPFDTAKASRGLHRGCASRPERGDSSAALDRSGRFDSF